MSAVLLGVLVYVLAQFAIGAWVSRRMTGEADYILAGRRLGVPLVAGLLAGLGVYIAVLILLRAFSGPEYGVLRGYLPRKPAIHEPQA